MWTDEARIRPETQHLWARHGSVSTVFEKGLLAFSAKKCVKCKDAARRAEPVAAKPEEKVQKSLSSLSWRTKWFSTPTQHFHLFLWLCADHIVPFPALRLISFARPPTLAALISANTVLQQRGETERQRRWMRNAKQAKQERWVLRQRGSEKKNIWMWRWWELSFYRMGGWLCGSSLQNSAVIVDCIWVPAASHALSGVRDPKHVSLFVSSQLISSDADGAIQRAGRFRVENGSSDEVQAANTGRAHSLVSWKWHLSAAKANTLCLFQWNTSSYCTNTTCVCVWGGS